MNITSAIEGREVCDELRRDLRKIRYNPDLLKMFRNIEKMVTDISRLEVECRRSTHRFILDQPLAELNKAVHHLKNLILMAKLME